MYIHHVAVLTRDLERSIAHYTSLYRFRLEERAQHTGVPLAFLRLEGDAALLELCQDYARRRGRCQPPGSCCL